MVLIQTNPLSLIFVMFLSFVNIICCRSSSATSIGLNPYQNYVDHKASSGLRAQLLGLKRTFEKVGSAPTKLKTLNVHDFGAKGDGKTDDTEVSIFILNQYASNSSYREPS